LFIIYVAIATTTITLPIARSEISSPFARGVITAIAKPIFEKS